MTYENCYNKKSRSPGFTLIEVVCGLTLLATLLVVSLMSFSRHARQVRSAQLRLGALEATDSLLASWIELDGVVPQEATGRFGEREELIWRTDPVTLRELEPFGAQVIRVSVWNSEQQKHFQEEELPPLLQVDLLVRGNNRSRLP